MTYADPFELLRRAKELIATPSPSGTSRVDWLHEYECLAGADLTEAQVRLLRDASLRCAHNADDFELLKEKGLLKHSTRMRFDSSVGYKVRYDVWTRNTAGREAVRLRADVHDINPCCE